MAQARRQGLEVEKVQTHFPMLPRAEKVRLGRASSSKDQALVIYVFFWLLYIIFLYNENAWNAFQGNPGFPNFLGGACPRTP